MTAVEYLVIEPRAVARQHSSVSAETRAATRDVATVVVAVSDGTCTRYLQNDIGTLIPQVSAVQTKKTLQSSETQQTSLCAPSTSHSRY